MLPSDDKSDDKFPWSDEESCPVRQKRHSSSDSCDDDDDSTSSKMVEVQERRLIRATITGFLLLVLALAHHHSPEDSTVPAGSESLRGVSAEWSSSTEPKSSLDDPTQEDTTAEWSDFSMHSSSSLDHEQDESSAQSQDSLLEDSSSEMFNYVASEELVHENGTDQTISNLENEPSDETAGSEDTQSSQSFSGMNESSSEDSLPENNPIEMQSVATKNEGEGYGWTPETTSESEESDHTSGSFKQKTAVKEMGAMEDELQEGRMEAQDNGN